MARVLIADDAAFMRLRCANLLKELGHEVIQAANGLEAVQMYQDQKPDAVLLDITMPEMDGLEALKLIRAHDPGARVAMVTALSQQAVVVTAIKSGARDFVVKPFERDKLVAVIGKLVG